MFYYVPERIGITSFISFCRKQYLASSSDILPFDKRNPEYKMRNGTFFLKVCSCIGSIIYADTIIAILGQMSNNESRFYFKNDFVMQYGVLYGLVTNLTNIFYITFKASAIRTEANIVKYADSVADSSKQQP